jgi:hypothetical protein
MPTDCMSISNFILFETQSFPTPSPHPIAALLCHSISSALFYLTSDQLSESTSRSPLIMGTTGSFTSVPVDAIISSCSIPLAPSSASGSILSSSPGPGFDSSFFQYDSGFQFITYFFKLLSRF